MSKHLEPFKDIMRDTSHLKTGRSRLIDCSAAGQLFEDEGRFRFIPGRFIVASAGSETRGEIRTVRSKEKFVYGWREVVVWNCGLSSIQVTFEVQGKLSRDARPPLLEQLTGRFNLLQKRGGTPNIPSGFQVSILFLAKLLCSEILFFFYS
jgi:hypothetical protein